MSSSLHSITVLENPRLIPKSKTIIFDSQIYLSSSEPAIIGSLQYFSRNNLQFDAVAAYYVNIHPAHTTPTIEVYSQTLALLDYLLFGDIVRMVPLGAPANIEIRQHSMIEICGVPSNIDKNDSTFDIEVQQYLSANKATDNIFPMHCMFPTNTNQWDKYKPLPGKSKPVLIEEFVTGIEHNDDCSIKHFTVDFKKVMFLSASPVAPKAEGPTKICTSGAAARLKFTGFFETEEPGAPATKKRKTADDCALKESQDKGEGASSGHCSPKH